MFLLRSFPCCLKFFFTFFLGCLSISHLLCCLFLGLLSHFLPISCLLLCFLCLCSSFFGFFFGNCGLGFSCLDFILKCCLSFKCSLSFFLCRFKSFLCFSSLILSSLNLSLCLCKFFEALCSKQIIFSFHLCHGFFMSFFFEPSFLFFLCFLCSFGSSLGSFCLGFSSQSFFLSLLSSFFSSSFGSHFFWPIV